MRAFAEGPDAAIALLKSRPFDASRIGVASAWKSPHPPTDVFGQDPAGKTVLHFWAERTVFDIQKSGKSHQGREAQMAMNQSMKKALAALNLLYLESVQGFLVPDIRGQTPWTILKEGAPMVLPLIAGERPRRLPDPTPAMVSDLLHVALARGGWVAFVSEYQKVWYPMAFGPEEQPFLHHLVDALLAYPGPVACNEEDHHDFSRVFPRVFSGEWTRPDAKGVSGLEHLARAPEHSNLAFLTSIAQTPLLLDAFEDFKLAHCLRMQAQTQDQRAGPLPSSRKSRL